MIEDALMSLATLASMGAQAAALALLGFGCYVVGFGHAARSPQIVRRGYVFLRWSLVAIVLAILLVLVEVLR